MTTTQNQIDHIAIVIDESGSMQPHTQSVIKVVDDQVAQLADMSKLDKGREIRVTVYTFANQVRCLYYDMDVLRLPSIAKTYRPSGGTALMDAVCRSQGELAQTAILYGDHAFLTYVVTDGDENSSVHHSMFDVQNLFKNQLENWTLGVFVPDARGVFLAKRFGFSAGNITTWNTTSERGVEEVGVAMAAATTTYLSNRTSGIRGSRALFAGGSAQVNAATVAASGIKPLAKDKFVLIPVVPGNNAEKVELREFIVNYCGRKFTTGNNYYQLTRPVKVQAQKRVAIVNKKTKDVYEGHAARQLLGLPDQDCRIQPDKNSDFEIYVQSTSNNRHLFRFTNLLIIE